MIRQLFFTGLLDTGPVRDGLMAVRDGFVNLYVIKAQTGLLCIDTGWSARGVARGFESLGLDRRDVAAIFLTHGHWDHARSLGFYPNAEVFTGEHEDVSGLSRWRDPAQFPVKLSDGQTVRAAGVTVQALHSPGHTPGSLSYLVEERLLFVGDTLRLRRGEAFPFPYIFNQDGDALVRSIRRLARIDGIECLLTAHTGITCDIATAFQRWRGQVRLEGENT